MTDIIRDSAFGQIVRLFSRRKVLLYPEERPGFEADRYYSNASPTIRQAVNENANTSHQTAGTSDAEKLRGRSDYIKDEETGSVGGKHEKDDSSSIMLDDGQGRASGNEDDRNTVLSRKSEENQDSTSLTEPVSMIGTQIQHGETRTDDESGRLGRPLSRPIVPVRTSTGTLLVDWYTTDDPANPQNWSSKKKFFVALQINLYTFAVYTSSSIYINSIPGVLEHFGVGPTKASLGLGMYVLGYGLGPLLWSPMSEIPIFGRNVPYIATFAIYVVLCVPTALVNNFGGLLFLRFITGFFGSPCLANGAASMQDIYSQLHLPYAVALWAAAAFLGPSLGPLLSGFSVAAEGWRWSLWEILWISAPVFILWFFFLPETSPDTILLYRARRLRQIYSNANIQSSSEIKQRHLNARAIAFDAIIKPFEIMFLDPAVLFTNVYTALIYGIYYSFFEAFPLVYGPLYGFNMGMTGVTFLTVIVGVAITGSMFAALLHWIVIPEMKKNGPGKQEDVLMPALIASFGAPIGLFLFGWTANSNVNYMASIVGIGIYTGTVYIVVLGIFSYIPMSYPPYAASLFASNDFCRSAMAFGAILFSRPMYINLGIGKGSSLLAGLSVLGIIGVWALFFLGERLRKRSKFALS